jgi:hypothetical protein
MRVTLFQHVLPVFEVKWALFFKASKREPPLFFPDIRKFIMLLGKPTANIDPSTVMEIEKILKRYNQEEGMTAV